MFHFHKYISFKGKGGGWPCVSEYCTKCGKIRSGNSIYYDGSVFQSYYKGNEAIKYLDSIINYRKQIEKEYIDFNNLFNEKQINEQKELFAQLEYTYRTNINSYETIEKYEEIKKLIK